MGAGAQWLISHRPFKIVYKIIAAFLFETFCNDKNNYYCPQRSWGKVIFSQASVILLTGGGLPQCMLGYHPPPPPPPPHPPSRHPREQTPPRAGADTNQSRACWEIWSMRGRYASYWNAILLMILFLFNLLFFKIYRELSFELSITGLIDTCMIENFEKGGIWF